MRRIGEKRQLENSLPRAQWKPVYAPILSYAGVLLSKAGTILQERYTNSSDIALRGEAVSE
jgi:hypothetical protein